MTSIAVIVGSTREGSFNRALGEVAAASLEAQGASVTRVDLAAFDLPLYSAALEAEAFPPDALRLKQLFAVQAGLLAGLLQGVLAATAEIQLMFTEQARRAGDLAGQLAQGLLQQLFAHRAALVGDGQERCPSQGLCRVRPGPERLRLAGKRLDGDQGGVARSRSNLPGIDRVMDTCRSGIDLVAKCLAGRPDG